MNNVTKFTKTFTIGELNFTIGINRAMAASAFKKYPQYYEAVLKNEELVEAIKKSQQGQEEINEKKIADSIEITSTEQVIEYVHIAEQIKIYSEKIVTYLFAQLLEYGETKLTDEFVSYEDYAKYIFVYCQENEVLADYIDEETETEVKGLISCIMDFISMGFTQGNIKKKGKVKIIMN